VKWAIALFLVLVFVAAFLLKKRPDQEEIPPPPPPSGDATFVSSKVCRSCHDDRYDSWLQTAHAYSLREAADDNVAGRFDGQPVESPGFVATPFLRDGGFWMRVEGKDGRPSGTYRISRIVGRSLEQAYLFTDSRGEWRVLPLSWSIEKERWDLTHRVLGDITTGEAMPENFDSRAKVFNDGCGQCHATRYDVGHDRERGTYNSTLLEGAVACESCHGPGSIHAKWHEIPRPGLDYGPAAQLLIPSNLGARELLESCGRCHYIHEWRYAIDDDPRVGFHDIAVTRNFDRPGFFLDGRLSGLNYHGSTQSQSACYEKGGMSCLSCHRMHGKKRFALKWEENDDRQCTQCHKEIANAPEAHTRHTDVRCVECHMPRFLKGTLHFLRDHSIQSPEPELTARFGEKAFPNACTLCHDDQTAEWAQQWREDWWAPTPRRLADDVALVAALREDAESVPTATLVETAERAQSRLFFRLTAESNLAGRSDAEARAAVVRLLAADVPEQRQLACEIVGRHPDPAAAPALLKLLDDPIRTIRVEAAFALVRCGWRGGPHDAIERAYREALLMLERQRHFDEFLARAAFLADVADEADEMAKLLQPLLARGAQNDVLADLLQRRARTLTERGLHADALKLYALSRGMAAGSRADLYRLDSAESLQAGGREDEANDNWQFLVQNGAPDSLPRLIAQARLDPSAENAEALRKAAAAARADPSMGELLRRAHYALKALTAPK
jgi:hypothetical protein